ncbi:flagellin [Natronomonas sp. EA1]|uniref:flagellin n=1 Tax=Natronomonas sp. EA1 TaxID=3421655 RepID=UPI003EBBEF1B
MGFSVSGATAVIFVGLLVSAAVAFPTLERSSERRTDAIDAHGERSLDRMNTDIDLINATYDSLNDELTVYVRNNGSTTLSANATDLLADGVYLTPDRQVEGEVRDVWAPGDVLRFRAGTGQGPLGSEPARVKVVAENGVATTGGVN